MKNLTSILLILASIGIFFLLVKPTYNDIIVLQENRASYDDALRKIDSIQDTLEEHQQTLADFDPNDVERVNKLLPDNADNVQLLIDINNIASNFGLIIKSPEIKDPRVEQGESDMASEGPAEIDNAVQDTGFVEQAPYNSIDLTFTVTSSYSNFVNFLKSLEKSLRLVDVVGISFVSPSEGSSIYDFKVTVRTYWLNR